jgi:lipoate-protein ligase A
VIQDGALPGHTNMARDHGLTTCLAEDEGILRLYRWDPPTISVGRNEPAQGRYVEAAASQEGIAFVRRPTGGRAVLHDGELTYALCFPVHTFGGLKRAYRVINKGLLEGIRLLGAAVELAAAAGPALRPDAGPCFRQPAEGEVMALGRKLIGSAQVRMDQAVLQHGSIILEGTQDVLRRLRVDEEPVPPPATLKSLLGLIPPAEVLVDSIQRGLSATFGGSWERDDYRDNEKMAARDLEPHYLDPEWTWRV